MSEVQEYNIKETAYRLHLSESTVCNYIRLGYIPAHKIHSRWTITEADIFHYHMQRMERIREKEGTDADPVPIHKDTELRDDAWYGTDDVAEMAHLNVTVIGRDIRRGNLKATRIGKCRKYHILGSDIRQYLVTPRRLVGRPLNS